MATSTTKQPRIGRVDDDEEQHSQLVDCFCERLVDCEHAGAVASREVVSKRGSRRAVEGGQGSGGGGIVIRSERKQGDDADYSVHGARRSGVVGGRTLPPPHAWLAIEDTKKQHHDSDPEDQWLRLLRGGGAGSANGSRLQQRRSSFSVVRRERAAREAWLDRAWEMKRSWHERNGGAPDANTPVVVVVGKESSSPSSSSSQLHAGAVGGGGVAMDVEEVRACRDLGLDLPSDCTVEIQCYGLSGEEGSPTHTTASSGADSPCGVISSPGADPVDVKARLKAWAQAVALTSTTQLGS